MSITIKGVKEAVGDYNRLNKGGKYRPQEGRIMLNRATGDVWTDAYSHNEHTEIVYPEPIIRLDNWMQQLGYCGRHEPAAEVSMLIIDMQTVRDEAEKIVEQWWAQEQ